VATPNLDHPTSITTRLCSTRARTALLFAILIAVIVGVVAAASRLPRLAVYTALLIAGGVGAAALDTNPGVPLLFAGAIVTAWGAVLTTRFVREHPVTEEA